MPLTLDTLTATLGAFDELEELGRGSFGTTFRAVRGDDVYAIKVVDDSTTPDFLWEREISILQEVEHPNVVRFRRSGRFSFHGENYRYFESEFIDGGTVRQAIAARQLPRSSDELRAFLAGTLAGIQDLHELGIIHRDIKPENVALREGRWGYPVILDFGLAKALGMSTHTIYPQHIGTVPYMSPEQLRAEPARTRSDLFSLGVVAFEAGTGEHPFLSGNSPTVQDLHDRIALGPAPLPTSPSSIWTADLRRVVCTCPLADTASSHTRGATSLGSNLQSLSSSCERFNHHGDLVQQSGFHAI